MAVRTLGRAVGTASVPAAAVVAAEFERAAIVAAEFQRATTLVQAEHVAALHTSVRDETGALVCRHCLPTDTRWPCSPLYSAQAVIRVLTSPPKATWIHGDEYLIAALEPGRSANGHQMTDGDSFPQVSDMICPPECAATTH
jgi:hypothetical protein